MHFSELHRLGGYGRSGVLVLCRKSMVCLNSVMRGYPDASNRSSGEKKLLSEPHPNDLQLLVKKISSSLHLSVDFQSNRAFDRRGGLLTTLAFGLKNKSRDIALDRRCSKFQNKSRFVSFTKASWSGLV